MNKLFLNTLVLFINLHFHGFINAQTIQQEKMKDLSFMAGDWVGTSKSIAEQETHSIPAYQNIQYKIVILVSIYFPSACYFILSSIMTKKKILTTTVRILKLAQAHTEEKFMIISFGYILVILRHM